MNKKLISNSLNVLYAKIGQCHSKALTTEVSAYLMMAVARCSGCSTLRSRTTPPACSALSPTAGTAIPMR